MPELSRRSLLQALALGAALPGMRAQEGEPVDPDYRHASPQALERWRDLKYGLRIHWGIYSLWADGPESWPLTRHDRAWQGRYCRLYETWDPDGYDPDAWADMMVLCGFRFFDFTAKHHDGFSLYATKTRVKRRFIYSGPQAGGIEPCDLAYSIMETPYRRDVVQTLIEAGRRRGLAPGLYFSHIDWYDADFRMDAWNPNRDKNYTPQTDPEGWARFARRHRAQIQELLTRYGPLCELSLDMNLPPDAWPAMKATIKMARRLQPDCLFRNRGIGAYGDYHTPENWIPDSPRSKESPLPWQVIHTLGRYMSYDPDPSAYRSGAWIVSNLADIVAKGGLFMVGIGPDGNGRFHPKAIEAVEEAGAWLQVNGEAIYDTRPWTYWQEGDAVRFTRSKNNRHVYALCLQWPGESLRLKSLRPRASSPIHMLGLHSPLPWRVDAQEGLVISLPEALQDERRRPCRHAWAFKIEAEG